MEYINRLKNVISQEEDLELLHELKFFPVFMGCVDHGSDKDLHADQSWSISKNNGIIQIFRLGFPGKRRKILLRYKFKDIKSIKLRQ